MRKPCSSIAAVGLFAALASSQQEPLIDVVAAAVASESWQAEFARRGLDTRPVGELVDALVTLRERLPDHHWARATSMLKARWQQVDQLWRDEPDRRRARAPAFADVLSQWVERHARAGTAERADIEFVAGFLPSSPWPEDMRGAPSSLQDSRDALQRASAAAERERVAATAHSLAALDYGSPAYQIVQGGAPRVGPFVLCAALVDADERLRARAAIALRLELGLQVPEWLARRIWDDPMLGQATSGRVNLPPRDAPADAFERQVEALEAGGDYNGGGVRADELDAAQRRRLAKALVASALRVPVPPWDEMVGNMRARDAADARAIGSLAFAASLGPGEHAAVVALAAASPDVAVTLRVLAALGYGARMGIEFQQPMDVDCAAKTAPILATLLDHADPLVVERAAALSSLVVPSVPGSELRATVVERALVILAVDAASLAARPMGFMGCGTGPRPSGLPASRDSWFVYAACASGDQRVLAPLLRALGRHADANGRLVALPDQAHNLELLLLGALRLAPHLDAAGARDLFVVLAPAFVPSPAPGWTSAESVASRHVRSALAAVLPRVLERESQWFAGLPPHERVMLLAAVVQPERVDGALAGRVLLADEEALDLALRHAPRAFLSAPGRLVEVWRSDAARRERAESAVEALWVQDEERVLGLVARGALPRALAMHGFGGRGLRQLAMVLPAEGEVLGGAAAWSERAARAIGYLPAGDPDEDLAALRRLASSPESSVALAAARRAVALGAEGLALASATIDRLLAVATDAEVATTILQAAVELRTPVRGLASALDLVRTGAQPQSRAVAEAAELRFAGLDPRRCDPATVPHVIALAGIDVDVATLREIVAAASKRGPRTYVLAGLLQRASAVTTCAALELLADERDWDGGLQRSVAQCTSHVDPRVRAAAYRALTTRDAALWPCTLLVHEVVFDPDPTVRAMR